MITHQHLFFFALVVAGLLLAKRYSMMKLVFNPGMLKETVTPRIYEIPVEKRKRYEKKLAKGIKEASNNSVLMIGMCRDIEERIPMIMDKVEALGKLFKDYKVLILENDSKDHTRSLLFKWRKRNPRINILGCGFNSDPPGGCKIPNTPKTIGHGNGRPRIEKMARLREMYLDYIKENISSEEYPYTIVWDLDSISVAYHDGILVSLGEFSNKPDAGVICANGIYQWGAFSPFYDTYAYLEVGEEYDPETHKGHTVRHGILDGGFSRGDDLHEVDSCFSGISIYRTEAMKTSSYQLPPGPLVCEHVAFHKSMKGHKKYMAPAMINVLALND